MDIIEMINKLFFFSQSGVDPLSTCLAVLSLTHCSNLSTVLIYTALLGVLSVNWFVMLLLELVNGLFKNNYERINFFLNSTNWFQALLFDSPIPYPLF